MTETTTEQSKPTIIDGKACCSECKTENLVYAYEVPVYCSVRVNSDGNIEAYNPDEDYSGSDGWRLFCADCGDELVYEDGIDVF